jgi:hypothetical protein
MTEMRQFIPQSGRFLGEPPYTDVDYVAWCPKCGRRLTGNTEGYGLAFGGGPGSYQFCSGPKCKWFYKVLDADEIGGRSELSKPSADGSGS